MKFFLFFLIGYIVYFLLGMLLPFTIHPKVDPRYRQSFDPSSFSRQGGCQERAMLIEENTDALIQRIHLIQAAKEEIILSTFDFRDDESGKDILSALYGAAECGVSVKILMDGYNCLLHMEGSSCFYALSSHPNVEIRIYNRLNFLFPWTIPGRMHDKYLIADNFGYIAGGRNINDLFLGGFIPKGQSRDRDILIFSGENGSGSIQSLRAYFSSVWGLPCCSSFHNNAALGKKKQVRQAASFLKEKLNEISVRNFGIKIWQISDVIEIFDQLLSEQKIFICRWPFKNKIATAKNRNFNSETG